MSGKPRLVALTLLLAPLLMAMDFSSWIEATDRRSNGIILQFMADSDLTTRLQAARLLGSRQDPYVADIMAGLYAGLGGQDIHQEELVLRVLLAAVFPAALSPAQLSGRALINLEGVDLLVLDLPRFHDPYLRAEIIRLGACLKKAEYPARLLAESNRIVRSLETAQGEAEPGLAVLIAAFLEAAKSLEQPDFLDPCLRIYVLSRQERISKQALETIRALGRRVKP